MTPVHADDQLTVYAGDALAVLGELPEESVQCVVTSPPYWGLRDYGVEAQIGLEPTPDAYVANMVAVFREVRRVLRSDGTVWLNLGDSYAAKRRGKGAGVKEKDLIGIPWRVAFALQADGWYLRSDIIWSKPNPMPESVTDRPTRSHEYVFLLAKSRRYYYDAPAIREAAPPGQRPQRGNRRDRFERDGASSDLIIPGQQHAQHRRRRRVPTGWATGPGSHAILDHNGRGRGKADTEEAYAGASVRRAVGLNDRWDAAEDAGKVVPGRNRRSVWTIPTQPYPGAHFASFPEALVAPCVLAGCPEGGVVLDPFAGTGTVGLVAQRLSRRTVLIELNPRYVAHILRRTQNTVLGLAEAAP